MRPAVKGAYTSRPERRPTLTLVRPFGRDARISASSNSTDQRGSRYIPMRPPPPTPVLRLSASSKVAALPNAPNSIVPRCCAAAGDASASAAMHSVKVLSDM